MDMDKYLEEVNQAPVLALTLVIAAGVGFSAGNLGDSDNGMDSGLEWSNQITIEKNGQQIDQFHNDLTSQGKEIIAAKLFNTSSDNTMYTSNNLTYIQLGNGTGLNGDKLQDEINCCGLGRQKASKINSSSVGTYTLERKFTADDSVSDLKVNTTGLYYDSSGNSLVSGGSFTEATLNGGDKLTVTHEITISGGS